MAEIALTPDQFRHLVNLTAKRAGILTAVERQNLLELAGLSEFTPRLDFGSNAQTFSQQLIRTLQDYGTLKQTGQPALVLLLRELATIVSGHEDEAAFVAALLAPYDGKPSTVIGGKRLNLFVSYRRKSWAFTHRMAGDLKQQLDADIFVDVSGVDQADFETSILSHLRACDLVLLVISEYTFSERIQDAHDWVRREIALALELRKPIVLIAVEGLFPPDPGSLPADIRGVTRMQGIRFFPDHWESALKQLAEFVPKAAASPVPAYMPATTPVAPTEPSNAVKVAMVINEANRLQQAIDLINDERFDEAVPILDALDKAQYRPRVVTPMLKQARDDAAAQITQRQADQRLQQRRQQVQDAYDEIALLTRNKRTLEQARAEWTPFGQQYPDWRSVIGGDPANLAALLVPPKPRFTLPLLEWINIPAGQVTLEKGYDGSKYSQDVLGTYPVAPFAITKYPVTNAQFPAFIDDGGYREDRYWKDLAKRETAPNEPSWTEPTLPRERVNWFEALAFTRWLAEKTGLAVTLPTEMQWQWAAVGDKGWTYPYGKDFDKNKCNTSESGIKKTTPVNQYPQGASPFGVMDMSGNIWEWCLNDSSNVISNDITNNQSRVLRGGSWGLLHDYARASCRNGSDPVIRFNSLGFRVVAAVPISNL